MRAIIIWSQDITPTLLIYALQKADYDLTVDWIDNIEAGFNNCIEAPPDLLIIKRSLYQRDDGLALCQKLHNIENLPYFPIVVGYIDVDENWEEAAKQVYQAGATLCFGRVSDVGKVVKQIAEILDNPISK
jgi:DNA-binding NarL/FixJ family response regulator